MPISTGSNRLCNSHLLSLLSSDELQSLLPDLELVRTEFKQKLDERNKAILYVYFPCSSVHSVLA